MQLRADRPDVWYAEEALGGVGPAEVAFLKERASASPRLRARICLHENIAAPVHEMVIVHHRSCYVRPARHPHKRETITALEGRAAAILFDDMGTVGETRVLDAESGPSLWRVPTNVWHALVILSEWFVFYEVSAGPWQPSASEFPAWAPEDVEPAAAEYIERLRMRLAVA